MISIGLASRLIRDSQEGLEPVFAMLFLRQISAASVLIRWVTVNFLRPVVELELSESSFEPASLNFGGTTLPILLFGMQGIGCAHPERTSANAGLA